MTLNPKYAAGGSSVTQASLGLDVRDVTPVLRWLWRSGRLTGCVSLAAVRFGRVPKREKARILAAMQQSSNSRSQEKAVAAELEDEQRLLGTVVRAHLDTCDFTRDKVEPMLARARDQPSYTACPPTLVSTTSLSFVSEGRSESNA